MIIHSKATRCDRVCRLCYENIQIGDDTYEFVSEAARKNFPRRYWFHKSCVDEGLREEGFNVD